MKLNIHIIYDALKKYSPNLYTNKNNELTLSQLRLPKIDTNLDKQSIYIMKADVIKENTSFFQDIDIISIGILSKEEKTSLSVIEISDTYDFITIFNEVQDIFSKYEKWNNNLMKSIASHESLQSISNKAATVLDNPFVIFDTTFKLITIGGDIPKRYQGTAWESVIDKEYVPLETFQFPDNDLYFFLKHNREIYYPKGSPYSSYTNIFLNLYVAGQLFAILAETDINAPFTNGQFSIIKYIGEILELALMSNVKNKGTDEILTYYIRRLLKELPVDEKILCYHLEERRWDINGYFHICTLSNLNGEKLSDNKQEFCLLRINKIIKNVITLTHENYIVVITKLERNEIDTAFAEEMNILLNQLKLHGGYSYIFYDFSEIRYYYNQSKLAILQGSIHDPEKTTWNFNDYYFQYIVNLLNSSTSLKTMCHPSILNLQNYDKENNTDFIKCFQTYLVNGCNVSQTGKDLFMHRNTLVYRLEKIQQILKIDLEKLQEAQRTQLWFSCMLCEYL